MSKSPVKFVGAAARVVGRGRGGSSNALNAMTSIPAFERILGLKKNRRDEAAGLNQQPAAAASIRVAPTQPLAKPIGIASTPINPVTPTVTNNNVNNTLAADPTTAPTVATDSLDPVSRQPMGGVQPVPNIQEQTTPEGVATYGVAGAAESMFGTPMQRQMSMGSSLMKRACKYKNKK